MRKAIESGHGMIPTVRPATSNRRRRNVSDELNTAFVPIRNEQGQITGIIDRATADYLASKAADPTQASLDELLASITRVRVIPFANKIQAATQQVVLLDTSDPSALTSFQTCFAIVENPETFGHCMCFGDPHIELFSGDRLLATLGYHHGFAIRWEAWKHDAWLKEPSRLLDWMTEHGVHGPRQEVERMQRQSEERQRHMERWLSSMPESLRPFWERMDQDRDPELHRELLEALRTALPTPEAQALALLGWFGSGAGPWSGYPSYETVANLLLLHYPTSLLASALTLESVTEAQWLGAARYFASWDFRQTRKADLTLLTPALRQRLLEAARKTEIADNIERASRAYAG